MRREIAPDRHRHIIISPAREIRPRSGETLTADEVRSFCHGQIAHNKIPRYVEFVDEFPMTVTGKIQKFMMRDTVEARLGLKTAKTA